MRVSAQGRTPVVFGWVGWLVEIFAYDRRRRSFFWKGARGIWMDGWMSVCARLVLRVVLGAAARGHEADGWVT